MSNSLDAASYLNVVKKAVDEYGAPTILNSDQGSQFTCREYIVYLKSKGIQISRDRKGRALENIFIKKICRTINYQNIYLNPSASGVDLFIGVKKWIEKYHFRVHQGIQRKKPIDIDKNGCLIQPRK